MASMTAMNPFIEHPAERREMCGGVQWRFRFSNGYGASVVRHMGSYGSAQGLWELAVLGPDGRLDYSTPITDNVVGRRSEAQIRELLRQIAELPAVSS